MSPYAPLYRSLADQAVVWLLVAVWILVGLVGAQKRFQDKLRSEAYLLATSRALLTLSIFIAGIYIVGLVFLVWLKIDSGLWFIWELMFGTSVIAVFYIVPLFMAFLLGWALIGRRHLRYSSRGLLMTALGVAGIAADALLYFALAMLTTH